MSSNVSRKETERTKLIQEKCQTLLTQMLRDEDNKYCVDCDAKGPRWASWNLGVFLCIRCAGIHRNLGVHISRVKSVNLDTWTPEQVISLQQMGNSRARAVYEAQLPDGFRRPQTDIALESFIRAKYEHKKYLAREWVPPSPPKVDWAKEIDEELERQKRKKKAAQASNALGIGVMSSGAGGGNSGSGDKKSSITGGHAAKSVPLPAPLPKPKPGQSGSSPKTQRLSAGAANNSVDHQTNDLLGLSTPTKPTAPCSLGGGGVTQDLHNDSFSGFLSAPVNTDVDASKTAPNTILQGSGTPAATNSTNNALAKEEQDFFNQGSLGGAGANDKDKSGKLTKDSILALYGAVPSNPHNQQQLHFGQQQSAAAQQQQLFTHNAFGGLPVAHSSVNFTGMSPGFMGGASAGVPPSQQQQHNPQFMTPPNSASMYNAPVMTVPTAFSTPGINGGMHLGNAGVPVGGFGARFQNMQHVGYTAQMQAAGMLPQHMMTLGGGIMATGQTTTGPNAAQLMHANHSRLSGMSSHGMVGVGVMQQQPLHQMAAGNGNGMIGVLGGNMPMMGVGGSVPAFQTAPMAGNATAAATTGSLNQQFGNLNIGNVWQ